MDMNTKPIATLVLRLMVGLALLAWPRMGSAQGTWSVISLLQQPSEVGFLRALAVDSMGNLYVAEGSLDDGYGNPLGLDRIQKRDARGNWSVIATAGGALGQVSDPRALAADAAGNLYVADLGNGRIQKQDAQGDWSVIEHYVSATVLTADTAGNLYYLDQPSLNHNDDRIYKRDLQGNSSNVTPNHVLYPITALAVDRTGNLYLAESRVRPIWVVWEYTCRISKQDVQGSWSEIDGGSATNRSLHGSTVLTVAVDATGSLYAAGYPAVPEILKRDALGGSGARNRGHHTPRCSKANSARERHPRRFGGCQGGGGTRSQSNSLTLPIGSVSPASIAGVAGWPPTGKLVCTLQKL